MIGQSIAHYTITEKIGQGGMGEVYRATDTKLKRDVALKVLPESFTQDPQRLARFTREAQVLASLNHPNIGAIHGLEEEDGVRALVLELIEGEDLSEHITKGPIPLEEALKIALQIAEALEAAHEKGIIHRDLKPANVKVTPDGQVKVLDFGLAKAMEETPTSSPEMTQSPTLTMQATQAGIILGTAAYMSPDQAQGKAVDRRADIWSFGVVLFEMLSGKRAFEADNLSLVLAHVLSHDPPWDDVPSDIPARVRDLVERCLRKDPWQRVQAIGDVRIAVQEYLADPSADTGAAPPTAPPPPGWQRWLPWAVAVPIIGGLQIGVIVLLAVLLTAEPPELPLRKLYVPEEGALEPLVSPDGANIAFRRDNSLWIRRLDQLEARQLEGTEGFAGPLARNRHFWSPDSASLVFVRQAQLWRISATEGGSQIICNVLGGPFFGGSWGTDDSIVFSKGGSGLRRVSATGGDPETILPYEQGTPFIDPHILPDGKGIVFAQDGESKIELFDGQSRRVLLERQGAILRHPVYSETGHLIFLRTGSNEGIWAIPYSLDDLEVTGQDFRLSSEVGIPSVSLDGTLVYGPGPKAGALRQLVWVSRTGEVLERIGQPQDNMVTLALSPDETRVAVAASEQGTQPKIWIHDIERGNKRVITFGDARDLFPFWNTDGDLVGYSSGNNSIQLRKADGSGQEEMLADGSGASVSSESKYLVYNQRSESTGSDLRYLQMEGDRTPQVFLQTPHDEDSCALSPDSNYLAYESDESGRDEIYLKRFPTSEGVWMLSVSGGADPLWSKDGKELYYWQGTDLMVVDVDTASSEPQRSDPQRLFSANDIDIRVGGQRNTDISRDGRFLMIQTVGSQQDEETPQHPIVVIQNWFAEFKDRP